MCVCTDEGPDLRMLYDGLGYLLVLTGETHISPTMSAVLTMSFHRHQRVESCVVQNRCGDSGVSLLSVETRRIELALTASGRM